MNSDDIGTGDTLNRGTMLAESNRVRQIDKWCNADLSDTAFVNQLFVRLIAKKKRFTNVDFTYAIFDGCYMRDCVFDSCNFTGCRFVSTNLYGSSFSGCKFDYATFERTNIDSHVLDSECPPFENLKMRFARTLRVNYGQIGDAEAVNKAICVELRAAELHLRKAWQSNESYYRKKYQGITRVGMFLKWGTFKTLDFIWGNGESTLKLARAVIVLVIGMAVADAWVFRGAQHFGLGQALVEAPQVLLGTLAPEEFPSWYLTLIQTS